MGPPTFVWAAAAQMKAGVTYPQARGAYGQAGGTLDWVDDASGEVPPDRLRAAGAFHSRGSQSFPPLISFRDSQNPGAIGSQ